MPELRRCPVTLRTPEAEEVLNWWTEWRTLRVLPWEGEIADQPQFVLDALSLCEETTSLVERDRTEKAEAEAERARRKLNVTRRMGRGRH